MSLQPVADVHQRARARNSPYADAFARLGPGAPTDYVIVWPSAVVGAVAPRHRLYGPWRLSASGAELGRPAVGAAEFRPGTHWRIITKASALDVLPAATTSA